MFSSLWIFQKYTFVFDTQIIIIIIIIFTKKYRSINKQILITNWKKERYYTTISPESSAIPRLFLLCPRDKQINKWIEVKNSYNLRKKKKNFSEKKIPREFETTMAHPKEEVATTKGSKEESRGRVSGIIETTWFLFPDPSSNPVSNVLIQISGVIYCGVLALICDKKPYSVLLVSLREFLFA